MQHPELRLGCRAKESKTASGVIPLAVIHEACCCSSSYEQALKPLRVA